MTENITRYALNSIIEGFITSPFRTYYTDNKSRRIYCVGIHTKYECRTHTQHIRICIGKLRVSTQRRNYFRGPANITDEQWPP